MVSSNAHPCWKSHLAGSVTLMAALIALLLPSHGCGPNSKGSTCGDGIKTADEECDNGVLNSDTAPDACRTTCMLPRCGDGVRDTGEECDDGNTTSGDGCSATCTSEGAVCGNGIVEEGEQCDDGNRDNGDGCDEDCQSEFCGNGTIEEPEECDDGPNNSNTHPDACRINCVNPYCGDGVPDTGEECDDGNNVSGDGCSATCVFEANVCGNGVVEAGEQCDDGNRVDGDGCDANCQFEIGTCGNGILEAGEQCDDGNNMNGDGCDENCMLEGVLCGNGVVDLGEECDDGPMNSNTQPDACRTTCQRARCGDGVVDTGELCDDGNNIDGDGCTHNCRIEVLPGCGNGVPDPGEECDDGNTTPCDGCSATCQVEACGNGRRECDEECDDGNTVGGDGCSATCTLEPITTCQPADVIACGQTRSANTSGPAATDRIDGYNCSPWNETGPEYAFVFTAPSSSTVTATLSGLGSDLDIFVLQDQAGRCDSEACIAFGDLSATFSATAGQTYYLVVDGYFGAQGPFTLKVTCGACGDGVVDPDEECDDGNTTSGDGCSETCTLESCGNGVVDVGEECDDGNTTPCDGCSASCQIEACGNGRVECGEECDDGNTASGDGCSATCTLEGGTCDPGWELTCGGSDRWSTNNFGATDEIDRYSCTWWLEDGPEYAYTFVAPQTGPVTVTLSELDVGQDLDIFVLSDQGGLCHSSNCLAYGTLSASFGATAGQTYYVVVDGYYGASGNYTVDLKCGGGACGDGVLNVGEECDDGNTAPGDGCSPTCRREVCGNGVLDPGEECDDGNTVSGDGCSATCKLETSGCQADWYLGCGKLDSWSNDGSGSTNNIDTYPGCVGWNESGPEYTYWFYAYETGQVTVSLTGMTGDLDIFVLEEDGSGCQSGSCIAYGGANVTFNAVEGEYYYFVVDGYNGATSSYTLDVSCATGNPDCGNGILEPGEQCDDGNNTSGDGCSLSCTLEGGTCSPSFTLTCGGSDSWTTEYSSNLVSRYGCSDWNQSGPEYTYQFNATHTGPVTVNLTGIAPGVDLDLFVLLRPFGSCTPGNCIAYSAGIGDEQLTFQVLDGETYYIVVEGFSGSSGSYDINVSCQ